MFDWLTRRHKAPQDESALATKVVWGEAAAVNGPVAMTQAKRDGMKRAIDNMLREIAEWDRGVRQKNIPEARQAERIQRFRDEAERLRKRLALTE